MGAVEQERMCTAADAVSAKCHTPPRWCPGTVGPSIAASRLETNTFFPGRGHALVAELKASHGDARTRELLMPFSWDADVSECSGHGRCDRSPMNCTVYNIDCRAVCTCAAGWSGQGCAMPTDVFKARQRTRALLLAQWKADAAQLEPSASSLNQQTATLASVLGLALSVDEGQSQDARPTPLPATGSPTADAGRDSIFEMLMPLRRQRRARHTRTRV